MNYPLISTIALLVSCNLAHADYVGTDDFSGTSRDASKWGTVVDFGVGQLSQTGDGVVRYSTTGAPTALDAEVWLWTLGNAPFNSSWSIQLDVNNPFVTTAISDVTTYVSIDLLVRHSADIQLNGFSSSLENSAGEQSFKSVIDSATPPLDFLVATSSTSAAVMISWDAAAHLLTSGYDVDGPVNGYSWTTFVQFDPTAQDTWKMDPADTFILGIDGNSANTVVNTGDNVYADNFNAVSMPSAVPEPASIAMLGIGLAGLGYRFSRRKKAS